MFAFGQRLCTVQQGDVNGLLALRGRGTRPLLEPAVCPSVSKRRDRQPGGSPQRRQRQHACPVVMATGNVARRSARVPSELICVC